MPFWACARTLLRREQLAQHFLTLSGHETYLPRLRERRFSHGRRVEARPALFPNYLFIRIELQWHSVRWAPGIGALIMAGDTTPARVPDGVIAALKARERGGLIELPRPPKFRPGDAVRVLHGPFIGVTGLYQGMRPHARVAVLLSLLGGQQRVVLGADAVERAP